MSLIPSTNCSIFPAQCELERKIADISIGSIALMSSFCSVVILGIIFSLRLCANIRQRLVLYLLLSNFCQSIGGMISLGWINCTPKEGMTACYLQAWILSFSYISAPLWSANIALFIALSIRVVKPNMRPGRIYEITSQVIWFLAACLATSGFFAPQDFFVPVSGDAWCWISPKYNIERMVLEYMWISIVMIFLFVIYTTVSCFLCQKAQKQNIEGRSVIFKLAGFPIIFFVVYFPLTAVRVLNSMGINLPLELAYVSVCFIHSDGLFNSLLYGYTRGLFRKLFHSINRKGSEPLLSPPYSSQ